jgi:hypothetical protein
MVAKIHGSMVYSFEQKMWHNIGTVSETPMMAEEILDQHFGGAFNIELRPLTVKLNGEERETGDFGIVRTVSPADPQERVFGYCTDRFHPLQPREVAQSFDHNVMEFAETMAFLGHGEDMFISWAMPTCKVRQGDEVEMYGIVRTGFDTLKGTRLFVSIYRPVCWNTITLAEGWAKSNTDGKGKGSIWRGKGINKNLLRDLGYWMAHVQGNALKEVALLEGFFGKLAQTPITSDGEAKAILEKAYPSTQNVSEYYPKELRDAKAQSTDEFNEKQEGLRDGIFGLFAGAGTAITPDYWGMLNSTSEYFCHVLPSKRPIAESVMFGNRQKQIGQMVSVLAELSK